MYNMADALYSSDAFGMLTSNGSSSSDSSSSSRSTGPFSLGASSPTNNKDTKTNCPSFYGGGIESDRQIALSVLLRCLLERPLSLLKDRLRRQRQQTTQP